ncbi:hypothetical protein [Spirosoma foliorum]|uniref:Non-reducing end beta-L-arabinofuranosidase-like GH127 C-terminal domain-containing protein n=1 Tax=Spirosoma foliorum TaxID=2710596 RepID=A0A7G5GVU5_9BACT|nr:hypothetical protein [Spirosoma foliorum]QMW02987.1 hypothetical protein H3H32_34745 [Spirosoma foliorum]
MNLPIQPRVVFPNDSIQTIKGKIAIASGPIVYSLEGISNPELDAYQFRANPQLKLIYKPELLNGVNVVTGQALDKSSKEVTFTAIPFYAPGNRGSFPYKVWLPKH